MHISIYVLYDEIHSIDAIQQDDDDEEDDFDETRRNKSK